jgi:hypothetical protein
MIIISHFPVLNAFIAVINAMDKVKINAYHVIRKVSVFLCLKSISVNANWGILTKINLSAFVI